MEQQNFNEAEIQESIELSENDDYIPMHDLGLIIENEEIKFFN